MTMLLQRCEGRVADVAERDRHVAEQHERHRDGKPAERRQVPRAAHHEARHDRQEQDVPERVGNRDRRREQRQLAVPHRFDLVDPEHQTDDGDEDDGVQDGARVPLGEPALCRDHQPRREQKVAGDVERIGCGRERVLPVHDVGRPDRVADRPRGDTGRDAQPRGGDLGPVPGDTEQDRGHDGHLEADVDQALADEDQAFRQDEVEQAEREPASQHPELDPLAPPNRDRRHPVERRSGDRRHQTQLAHPGGRAVLARRG
jgi:hypothetical protein